MIKYRGGVFGFQILFRLHGSAVFKSLTPALLSCLLYLLLYRYTDIEEDEYMLFDHPYPMAALIAAFTFLLAFRANFSYNRYWGAFTDVHQMHSKWMDVGMDLAAFHLQSKRFDNVRPPAFGEYPNLSDIERERIRINAPQTLEEIEEKIDEVVDDQRPRGRFFSILIDKIKRKKRKSKRKREQQELEDLSHSIRRASKCINDSQRDNAATNVTTSSGRSSKNKNSDRGGYDKNRGRYSPIKKIHMNDTEDNHKCVNKAKALDGGLGEDQAPIFLQEAAHLLSLLSAVALSTLRNDIEGAESPLIQFEPGIPFPHVDPDDDRADVRTDWEVSDFKSNLLYGVSGSAEHFWTTIRFLFGISRTKGSRTLYNAARPLRVIGGVSDAEIEMLQAARGPLAKVALCTLWVQEFISREYLAGSTGKVAPPIISRLFQFISDGMLGYNHARKVAYIPFPFPHAQITSLFVLIVMALIPVLMLNFVTQVYFGFALNLFTVMAFAGLHEVSRELEEPFQNMPNDVPLNNFQAQFNESLMVMFFGYHPDSYWEIVPENDKKNNNDKTASTADSAPATTDKKDSGRHQSLDSVAEEKLGGEIEVKLTTTTKS